MANEVTPIVTKLTLSELTSLVTANRLEEGLQYLVTDKDWLLLAVSINTLQPIAERLVIDTTTIVPNWILCNKFIMDTGVINYDIYGINGLTINCLFAQSKAYILDRVQLLTPSEDPIEEISINTTIGTMSNKNLFVYSGLLPVGYSQLSISALGITAINTCRFLIYILVVE